MDRDASAAMLTELDAPKGNSCHLVSIETSGGTVYMTDAFKDIEYDSNTYVALGDFLGFTEIDESSTLSVSSVTVSLSGVDQVHISNFLNNDFIDRDVFIYKAALNSANVLVEDPIQIFSGRIDEPAIAEDPDSGTCTIAVNVTNHWIDFERTQYRSTTHECQQLHFPGDMFFEFASEVTGENYWGKKT